MCADDFGCTQEKRQEHLHNTMKAMKYEYERYLKNENVNDNENKQDDETEI